ncbi:MAG: hypothetical protein ACYTDU_17240 [Planctomycetota bacterium]
MILFAALGFAGSYFFAWRNALPIMVLAGLILAQLVPAKGSCSVPQRDEPG